MQKCEKMKKNNNKSYKVNKMKRKQEGNESKKTNL